MFSGKYQIFWARCGLRQVNIFVEVGVIRGSPILVMSNSPWRKISYKNSSKGVAVKVRLMQRSHLIRQTSAVECIPCWLQTPVGRISWNLLVQPTYVISWIFLSWLHKKWECFKEHLTWNQAINCVPSNIMENFKVVPRQHPIQILQADKNHSQAVECLTFIDWNINASYPSRQPR